MQLARSLSLIKRGAWDLRRPPCPQDHPTTSFFARKPGPIGNVPIERHTDILRCEKTSLSWAGSHVSYTHEGEWSILHRAPRRARRRRRGVGLAAILKANSSSLDRPRLLKFRFSDRSLDRRMKRHSRFATAMTTLLLLAMPLAAVAAPTYRERYKCYEPCREQCADRYSCENPTATRNCFTNFNKCKSVCRARCYH